MYIIKSLIIFLLISQDKNDEKMFKNFILTTMYCINEQ